MIKQASELFLLTFQTLNICRLLSVLLIGFFVTCCTSNSQVTTNKYCHSKYPFQEWKDESHSDKRHNFSQINQWMEQNKIPVISILLSKRGEIIYEFYASPSDRDTARNTMSVTKSIASALVGITLDHGFISSPNASIVDYLPPPIQKEAFEKLKPITINNVMAMSALDASTWPKTTRRAIELANNFHLSKNRLQFAIKQNVVKFPGKDFNYTDITPAFISAILQNVTHKNLFDLANLTLFQPMGFKGQRWLFRDDAGYDNAAYGLELRPIDMHKFGVLYLNQGCWDGQQLVPSTWVEQSFTPQIKSYPESHHLDYGWFWWKHDLKPGWSAYLAKGWHGQRLAIIPEKEIVISITANAPDISEKKIVKKIFDLLIKKLEQSSAER